MRLFDLPQDKLICITLTQPWATLIVTGWKRIETRGWRRQYTGPLGIHAAKGFPKWAKELCNEEPFKSSLERVGYWPAEKLPTAALIGHTTLERWVPLNQQGLVGEPVNETELAFGDYHEGRWGLVLGPDATEITPIPMKGALGLWSAPKEVLAR